MRKIEWIDIMKGIGISTVVVGHMVGGFTGRFIYVFHMSLFFFLSGYLFTSRTNCKQYFSDKILHLIIPYLCFLIPLYIYFNPIIFSESTSKEILLYFFRPIVGGIKLSGALTVFWFVTCLFLVQQIMNFIVINFNSITVRVLIILRCY